MEKNHRKRWIAGTLAFIMCCTAGFPSGIVAAAETDGVYQEQPKTTELQTEENKSELISEIEADPGFALTITAGDSFEIMSDFTGLGLKEDETVELVTAVMEDGTEFDRNVPGTYKCVYQVTPKEGDVYLVARYIMVMPQETGNAGEENATEGSEEYGNAGEETEGSDNLETEVETELNTETEPETEPGTELPTEVETEPETEPSTEAETETESEPATEAVTEVETEAATEPETETETIVQPETEQSHGYQVTVEQGEGYHIRFNHEDGRYDAGEQVEFSVDPSMGSMIAVAALMVQSNELGDTEDLRYAEVAYHADTDRYSFTMPEEDILLRVFPETVQGSVVQIPSTGTGVWSDEISIQSGSFDYSSDCVFHPFDTVMGSGGNASYKYVSYEAYGKTYTVNAYGMQHSMAPSLSGTVYDTLIELDEDGDDKYLRKALFYGYGGPGWGNTFKGYNIKAIMEKYGCTDEARSMQQYLVDYLYDGESGWGGALSQTAKDMLKEIKAALSKMPDPLSRKILPGLSVKADGTRTETFTWKANEAFTIMLHLESGVSLVNETTGKTFAGNVTIKGGEKFHLVAEADAVGRLKGSYPITSNYPLDFHAMLVKLEHSQDIGFGYYTDSPELSLKVDWPEQPETNTEISTDTQSQENVITIYGENQGYTAPYSAVGTTSPAEPVTVENEETETETITETEAADKPVQIPKIDIYLADSMDGKAVPGTMLAVYDENGNILESWISQDGPHRMEKLMPGRYILREEQTSEGYLLAEDVVFDVTDTEEIQKVYMKKERPTGRLILKVTEKDTKEPLEGAEFELKEKESQKTVAKMMTDEDGIAKEENLLTALYQDGKLLNAIEYVLVETKAPEGYELYDDEIPIVFTYLDGKTKEISITKELPHEKSSETTQTYAPKNQDKTNLWLPVFVLVLSIGGIAGVVWYVKKKDEMNH